MSLSKTTLEYNSFVIVFFFIDTKGQRDGGLVVSTVFPGSVAHRTGSVQAGDRLLAINNSPEDSLALEEALGAFQSEQVIRLKLQKGEPAFDEMHHEHEPVVFTVELVRHGGPLGITISGTENPNDPITISGLTEGTAIPALRCSDSRVLTVVTFLRRSRRAHRSTSRRRPFARHQRPIPAGQTAFGSDRDPAELWRRCHAENWQSHH